MERYERMVREALKAAGARYKSANKHEKWELPDGRCVTIAVSSSDMDFWKIKWGEVRKLLGLAAGLEERKPRGHGQRRHKPGIRRPVVAELVYGSVVTVWLNRLFGVGRCA